MNRLLHSALAVALAVALAAAPGAQQRAVDADPGGQAAPSVLRSTADIDDRDPGPRAPTLARPQASHAASVSDADDLHTPVVMVAPLAFVSAERLDNGRSEASAFQAVSHSAALSVSDLDDGRTSESAALAEARALAGQPYTGPMDDGRPPGTRPTPVVDTDAPEAFAAPQAAAVVAAPFGLSAVSPNPASDRAVVVATAETAARATITVYDVQGRQVAVAFEGVVQPEAPTRIAIDLADLAPGTYVVVMDVGGERDSRTFQVVR